MLKNKMLTLHHSWTSVGRLWLSYKYSVHVHSQDMLH